MSWIGRMLVVVCICLTACSPALDWREVRPEGTGLSALFPCKPSTRLRELMLGARSVTMAMAGCTAAGSTYALSHADVIEASHVGPVLTALRDASARNVGGGLRREDSARVVGMTPNDQAARWRIDGHLPGGEVIHVATELFVHGTVVFQASVVASQIDDGAVDVFFSSLKLGG